MRVLPSRPVRPGLPGGEPVPPRPPLMGERWAGRRLPRVLLPYLSRDIEGELSRWEREKMRRHGVFEDDISRWEAERDRADAALRERRRKRREERLQEEARRERERFLDELSDIPRESRRPVRSKPRRPEPEEILPDIEEEGWLPEEVARALKRVGIRYDRLGRPRDIKTGELIVRGPGGRLIVGRPEGEGGFVTVRRPGEEPVTKEIQPRPRIEPGPKPDLGPAEILHHFGLLPGLPKEQEAAVRWARDMLQRGDLEHETRHGVPYTLDTPQEFISTWEEERRGAKLHPRTIEMIYALPWPAGGRVETGPAIAPPRRPTFAQEQRIATIKARLRRGEFDNMDMALDFIMEANLDPALFTAELELYTPEARTRQVIERLEAQPNVLVALKKFNDKREEIAAKGVDVQQVIDHFAEQGITLPGLFERILPGR